MKKGKILVVDDNAGIRSALKLLLPLHFEQVRLLSSPSGLVSGITEFNPDAVLLDMNFERDINTGNEGLFWLSEMKRRFPEIQVVLFTAYADIALAVEGMKRGAFDFIVKPWDNDKLLKVLSDACVSSWQGRENRHVQGGRTSGSHSSCGKGPDTGEDTMHWGKGPAMTAVRRFVEKIAPTDATVLITGENGTGKDLMAREIHRFSRRSAGPMVCVDMGAITETLFESELFGHVKGAFTDARSDHKGKFGQADGGTLFLDEIGNIPLHLQSKLLRVLQSRAVVPVGGSVPVPVDIRLVCATNMDLEQMVREGRFREDLYYRINTMQVKLPPLRDRKDEIIPLACRFTDIFAAKYGRKASGMDEKAMELLLSNRWSGNIRELRNCIEKAVIISEGKLITADDLSFSVISGQSSVHSDAGSHTAWISGGSEEEDQTLDMVEEKTIRAAVAKYNGNLSLVAKALDISRPTLYSKLKKYNI